MQYEQTAVTSQPNAQPARAKSIRDNAEAGLGAGALLTGFGLAVAVVARTQGIDLSAYAGHWAGLSLAGGLSWFGWLSFWRNSIDEFRDSAERRNLIGYGRRMSSENKMLRRQVADLQALVAKLKAGDTMQQRAASAAAPRRTELEQAESDARRLLDRAFRGQKYSRDVMMASQWKFTKARWQQAGDLLARAGLAYWDRKSNGDQLRIQPWGDLMLFEDRLEERVDYEADQPASFVMSNVWPLFMSSQHPSGNASGHPAPEVASGFAPAGGLPGEWDDDD